MVSVESLPVTHNHKLYFKNLYILYVMQKIYNHPLLDLIYLLRSSHRNKKDVSYNAGNDILNNLY